MLVFNFNKDFQSKFIWIDSHCENYGKAYSLSGMAGNLVTELHCKSNADFHLSEDKMSKETRICYSFIRLQKKKGMIWVSRFWFIDQITLLLDPL